MNFIRMADGVTGLLPKKHRVTLMSASGQEKIGEYRFREDQFPAVFDKPTLLEADGKIWRVLKASILREASYLFSRKIVLDVEEAAGFSIPDKFSIPTMPFGSLESFDAEKKIAMLELLQEEWRQIEFLPIESLSLIQQDIENIERIVKPAISSNPLLGYDEMYLRNQVFNNSLQILLQDFWELVGGLNYGTVSFGQNKFVQNGFALQSARYTYYGTCVNERILELSVLNFESIDEEFINIANQYGLVLVDWCNARVFMGPPEDSPEKEIVKF